MALVLAILLAAGSAALLIRALTMPSMAARARLADIEAYGFPAELGVTPGEGTGSIVERLSGKLGGAATKLAKGDHADDCRKLLSQAGMYKTPLETFMGYRLLGALAGGGSMLLLAPSMNPALGILAAVVVALCGWTLPYSMVRRRAETRQYAIERELPELIDLLVVTLEAGLSFSGSLQLTAQRLEGPLKDELGLALQEQRMGLSVADSLQSMLDRCDGDGMRSFVRSVLQGETLGVSIGNIMRGLAVEMRKRRRQMAEEQAQKAPIKILFPLVFLIFPAMFIVLLYPAVSSILEGLANT